MTILHRPEEAARITCAGAERALFARIRSALDPAGTLNPNVLPRLSGRRSLLGIAVP